MKIYLHRMREWMGGNRVVVSDVMQDKPYRVQNILTLLSKLDPISTAVYTQKAQVWRIKR